jgi:hypothetical protein
LLERSNKIYMWPSAYVCVGKELRALTRQALEPDSTSKGGILGVEGWLIQSRDDIWRFLEEGVEDDLNEYDLFDSSSEMREFIQGSDRYQDRNSFSTVTRIKSSREVKALHILLTAITALQKRWMPV